MYGAAQPYLPPCLPGVQALQSALGMDPLARLHAAIAQADAAGVAAALAAGAPVDGLAAGVPLWPWADMTPLSKAARMGHVECARLLLNAGADVTAQSRSGWRPLHLAALDGHAAVISLLLAAGADPLAASDSNSVPLHLAAMVEPAESVRILAQAAPEAAGSRNIRGRAPFDHSLRVRNLEAARCLLACGAPPQQASEMLLRLHTCGGWAQPLFAALAARQPLTPAEWARVPTPCAGIGAALPAVLERSEMEAALLVRHLSTAEQQRLRTFALCLERSHFQELPLLPAPIVSRLLALSVA